ncbi:unnamed protein product [Cylicocyclus nassatus]|uniref:Uncharacterized protein n=1 Tax=Cylicocyclus nassatus TaxID=53992 RepID=A0AA36HGY4_CYLNA|nr:unnamed protein product [Cylicocyclus nassatus]
MDPIYDTEVVFTESFAPKPVRTFVVNTNAALHSINANVEPSSGVCTFPANSQFPDRFILCLSFRSPIAWLKDNWLLSPYMPINTIKQKKLCSVRHQPPEGMDKMVSIALERAAAKEEDELGLAEYVMSDGPAHDSTFMRSQIVRFDMRLSDISDYGFLNLVEPTPDDTLFGGSFTCGLIAARLRHVVKQRLDIARSLLALIQLYSEDSGRYDYPMFEFSDLERKLSNIINNYRLFDDQLSLKLANWFFKGEGVDWLSKVAHIGRFEEADPSPEFNVFLDKILEAGLLFLSPYSAQVFLARSLALHEQYAVLMNLCTLSASSIPDELRPVMTFYSAIAYSGIGKPLKAMTNFNLAAKGVTDQNKLLTALSPVGKTQEINLGDYYVMVRCLSHISEKFNGVYQA